MSISLQRPLPFALSALAFACTAAQAQQQPAPGASEMPTVTVQGQAEHGSDKTRLSGATEAMAASVSVVDAEEVATINVGRDISNIFRRVPGVVANSLDQGDTGHGFKMRGFATQGTHGADTAVYIDGVPQNMPSSEAGAGHGPAFIEWLTPDMIERIEVIKGPLSVRHGDQNRSGAVNIVTRSAPVQSSVALSMETYGGRRASLLHSARLGRVDSLLIADVYRSDGYRAGSWLDRDNLFWKLSFADAGARYSARLNHYRSDFETAGYLNYERLASGAVARSAPEENLPPGFGAGRRTSLVLERAPLTDSGLQLTAYAENFERTRATTAASVTTTLHNVGRDDRNIVGASAAWRWMFDDAALLAGADLRRDRGDGTRQRYQQRRPSATWLTNLDLDLLTWGVFAEVQYKPARDWRLTAGMRHDWFDYDIVNRKLPDASLGYRKSVFTPKLGAAWSPGARLTVFANAAEGFRSAAAQQLSPAGAAGPLDAAGGRADAGLAPSKVRSYDAGLQAQVADGLTVGATYFYVLNEDELVQTGPTSFASVGDTTRRGAELDGRWQIARALSVYGSYTRLFEAQVNNPLPNTARGISVARHQAKAGLEIRQAVAGGTLRYHLDGYVTQGIPYASGTPLTERIVPTHVRYDARVSFDYRKMQLSVFAVYQPHDIGESYYASATGLWVSPQPRRHAGVAARYFF